MFFLLLGVGKLKDEIKFCHVSISSTLIEFPWFLRLVKCELSNIYFIQISMCNIKSSPKYQHEESSSGIERKREESQHISDSTCEFEAGKYLRFDWREPAALRYSVFFAQLFSLSRSLNKDKYNQKITWTASRKINWWRKPKNTLHSQTLFHKLKIHHSAVSQSFCWRYRSWRIYDARRF